MRLETQATPGQTPGVRARSAGRPAVCARETRLVTQAPPAATPGARTPTRALAYDLGYRSNPIPWVAGLAPAARLECIALAGGDALQAGKSARERKDRNGNDNGIDAE